MMMPATQDIQEKLKGLGPIAISIFILAFSVWLISRSVKYLDQQNHSLEKVAEQLNNRNYVILSVGASMNLKLKDRPAVVFVYFNEGKDYRSARVSNVWELLVQR